VHEAPLDVFTFVLVKVLRPQLVVGFVASEHIAAAGPLVAVPRRQQAGTV
jgi:hypothetical protein